ncbi:hypothetical protein MCOR25_004440 [Pyricularia grisea]|uniref:AB hydrolase-1 domain-containing protein n=1 Tax=Pyricularia grisea TaxID=148305 RepID=A0A6P8AUQ3_PYRGI|nr:uncharacterized protein PgNI_08054 [Pyricularia grisea]KAI6369483.1 hypothetical protein MCOR25_004440 [Pyricularia grisea]TLD05953.1 hypothetical protein PgNI_08054 [Pyricularia grisea]
MTSTYFHVVKHTIDASHIREYPRATANSQEEVLKLVLNQYIPKNNPEPQPGDVTIIGAEGGGLPKELYEPLWDDILAQSSAHGFKIRSIWIADMAWQGESGVVNKGKLGNDPSWADAERDILQMITHFRIPAPMVGIGHSLGGPVLAGVSLLHPRLFRSIMILEPIVGIWDCDANGTAVMVYSATRHERFPSRDAAKAFFSKHPFYETWDPRIFEAWIRYGLQDDPESKPPAVRLVTPRDQEVFSFLRPIAQRLSKDGKELEYDESRIQDFPFKERRPTEDYFYQPSGARLYTMLPHVRPSVLYVFGGASPASPPEVCKDLVTRTGSGLGGSGGVGAGKVASYVIEGFGHLVPMERPKECAQQCAAWIGSEISRWRKEELEELQVWWSKPGPEKCVLTDQVMTWLSQGRPSKL